MLYQIGVPLVHALDSSIRYLFRRNTYEYWPTYTVANVLMRQSMLIRLPISLDLKFLWLLRTYTLIKSDLLGTEERFVEALHQVISHFSNSRQHGSFILTK